MSIFNKKNSLLALLILVGSYGSAIQCGNAQKKQEKKLNTLLLKAVENNNEIEIINLIKQGANVNMHNNNGESLFDITMKKCKIFGDRLGGPKNIPIETAKILVKNNFNPNNKGKDWFPLKQALISKNIGLTELLINKGADVTIFNENKNLLSICIRENMLSTDYRVCKLFLRYNLVDSKECEEYLIYAIKMALTSQNMNFVNTVKLFLKHGTSIKPNSLEPILKLNENSSHYKHIIDLVKNRHIIYILGKNSFHKISAFYDCNLIYTK